jgi:hypothetical protein
MTAAGEGLKRSAATANYLRGQNPNYWRRDIPLFTRVFYHDVYPGIDVVYYGNQGQLEYNLVLAPGADSHQIRLAISGADTVSLNAEGDLLLSSGGEQTRFHAPQIYQESGGARQEIRGRYVLLGRNQVAFRISQYDPTKTLTIDPVLTFSTYLGGSRPDRAYGVAADSAGCAYIVGETWSVDFPAHNAAQMVERGDRDVFVAKLTADGTSLIYATYLGGNDMDSGRAIAVDSSGAVYITGITKSLNFPTVAGSFRRTPIGQSDVFVTKLSPSGSAVEFSTYIRGAGDDTATGIAVDNTSNVYVAGYTSSYDFPTYHAFQSSFQGGPSDAFVFKLDASGSTFVYSSYIGGVGNDVAMGIALNASGEAFLVGSTDSVNFPIRNPVQSKAKDTDAFLVRLDASGTSLVYSTCLGGNMADTANAVTVAPSGAAYITGSTNSNDFPFTSGGPRSPGRSDYDAFVAKISTAAKLVYPVRLGGTASEEATAIVCDAVDNVYIAGYTFSYDLPVKDALQNACGGSSDGFLAGLNPQGDSWQFVTYLGGAGDDRLSSLAIDKSGHLYVTGFTTSSNFPTTRGVVSPIPMGGMDGFVTKYLISIGNNPPTILSAQPSTSMVSPQKFTFVARDPDGYADINYLYFLISNTASAVPNTCHGFYFRPTNTLYLYDDSLTTLTAATAGSTGTLQNSRCSIDGGASGASAAGTDLTLQIGFGLKGTYLTGTQKVYLWIVDNESHGTGWIQTNTWTPPTLSAPPAVVSASPATAAASPQTFTFVARDPDGYGDINYLYFLISNTASAAPNTCHGFYFRPTNTLYLYDDSLTTLTAVAAGSAGTLQNSRCSIDGGTSGASAAGTDLTLQIGFGLKGTYLTGTQKVYLWIVDNESHGTGWIQTNTWTPPTLSAPPAVVSASPATATASPQTFTFVARDPDGYADINYIYFLISNTASAVPSTCHGFYFRPTNTLYLYDDSLTTLTAVAAGSAGTLQNSRCFVDGGASGVSAAGTDLTLTIRLGLLGTYLTASQNIYIWIVDSENHGTGWIRTASWTRP